ncbi:hypothetical protein NOVOSPHI9U_290030 [Novosphingobium sp. 9U]|nr:hypothetical protein NOVOSPHI9U_290030 [Novosphingobium sp. 9U]
MARRALEPCPIIPARYLPTMPTAVLTFAMQSWQKAASPGSSRPEMWGRDEQETLRKLHEWNQPNHRVRGRIEKIFGTWKRSYGLRLMRWRGLPKAAALGPPHRHRLQPQAHDEHSRCGLRRADCFRELGGDDTGYTIRETHHSSAIQPPRRRSH